MVGADLVNLANDRLAGYENAVSPSTLMSFVNEGKDAVWNLMKSLDKEYFMQVTQNTSPASASYFPSLTAASREYTLPSDCSSLEFIECLTPGYQTADFEFLEMNSTQFKELRRAGGVSGQPLGVSPFVIYYTIVGKDQFVLVAYPPATLALRLWYIRSIPDYESDTNVDDIVFPYAKLIANYAVQKALLSIQDPVQFTLWVSSWKSDVIELMQNAGDRDTTNAQFAEDYNG